MLELLFFVFGSAAGAFVTWFIGGADWGRLAIARMIGVVSFVLGTVTVLGQEFSVLAAAAPLGFLGAATPLTLCLTPMSEAGTVCGVASAVRRSAVTLALALFYGTGCGALGFVAAQTAQLAVAGR